ncbi:MAG: hypothetical protein GC150_17520 [Rhizobiales bacterium]|nr:hypothetical protein [Hyphomicrobiales bacterium]
MLGRTAASLYWMSRYMERAENMTRLVEVGYRIMLTAGSSTEGDEWRSALAGAGCLERYLERYDKFNKRAVVDFLLFDPDNPSSVESCLKAARNNARAVRIAVTREMWDALNTTWVEFGAVDRARVHGDGLPEFLTWVRSRALLFRGALLGTLLRNQGYHFSQLGAFVERADQTARILDVKYYVLLPRADMVGGEIDTLQWEMILRSVSAHRSYRHVFHDGYKPWNIAEFMILMPQMPRSLRFSYDWIDGSLSGLDRIYGERMACHDMSAATLSRLTSTSMTEVFQGGLHEFLMDFTARNNALGVRIAEDYHFN